MLTCSGLLLNFLEGHLWAGSKTAQNFMFGEFLQYIVHCSASDKLAIDSLVMLVCGLGLKERERVSGGLFPIKDLWTCWSEFFKFQCYPSKNHLKILSWFFFPGRNFVWYPLCVRVKAPSMTLAQHSSQSVTSLWLIFVYGFKNC